MLLQHIRIELLQLPQQQFVLFSYIIALCRHHEEQERVALYVTQETQSEPLTLCSTLYDTGYISHHERLSAPIGHDAERGFKRSKRIISYLGTRR